jgi:glycosyltransferase involved in cell wall biosynthesis
MDRSRVAVVIPALNESATIRDIVVAVARYGVPIVVDDGSTDNSAALAEQAGAVVVSHGQNLGYDAALNSGFKAASEIGSELILTVDADGQHDPSLLQRFIDQIDSGSDVVVGIRSRRQRLAEHLFAGYTSLRFGIKDPLCGMKAYRTAVYRRLGHFDSYRSIGTELILFAARNGFRISQIPFVVRERLDHPRFGRIALGNYRILRALMLSIWRVTSGSDSDAARPTHRN